MLGGGCRSWEQEAHLADPTSVFEIAGGLCGLQAVLEVGISLFRT